MSEQLVSKQGPLGYVWLAANYDKKLSKQQLLSTNIVKSSDYITSHPIHASQSTQDPNSITLRLSGQLLLGIVRIYSRKTKYLLDDVNDILMKLKTSFRYASGAKLGSDISGQLVNLLPQDTIIANLKSITLQDQVTRFDLLYQDDLNLDDDVPASQGIFSQQTNTESTFDQSIEFPRFEDQQEPPSFDNDLDLELDFDLTHDRSIEEGRNASQTAFDQNASILADLNKDDELDLGNPLETIDEPDLELDLGSDEPEEPLTPPETTPVRPRQKRTRITEDGELITNKRKLQIDSMDDLDGIPIQTLKDNQQLLLNGQLKDKYITMNLSEQEKLQLVYELSAPLPSKKRKLWDMDSLLQEKCLELSRQEQELEEQHNLQFETEFNDYDDNLDFDLSLPDFSEANVTVEEEQPVEEIDEDDTENAAQTTVQIAQQLRSMLTENSESTFNELMESDSKIQDRAPEKRPVGAINRGTTLNHRKEATKCFFELLVLATNDCLELEQQQHQSETSNDITIRSRDALFRTFV